MNDKIKYHILIQAVDGGKDSKDCIEIISKMYLSYLKKNQYKYIKKDEKEIIIYDLELYDKLKKELGIHRIIRVSPYKKDKRHTSSLSVSIIEKKEEELHINSKDLRIDCFRSQGKGGQHVNKTETAVRIVHLPSGISAVCQDERSQYENKTRAMKNLKEKLLNEIKNKSKKYVSTEKLIRSYFFFPYFRIINHTNKKKSTNKKVLEGELQEIFN